ncbi:methylmalonyl-CoA mutase family protein [Parasegetibacter sp. NRK P23]|uniref:methylmalonyl-CoA mutase family protein n=1 Tax=Parasegetibacter sp. NRK P23 TaxID=2942999 RepID=UPI002043EDBE|nr:methylmalonyl-CoA mutase family protein [Parasegetibacter sp. NRK P23]MCM5527408.1 methylmalonyl-CoA mutase family protein [Parasegetibacter sp. NRK P23]
MKRIEEEKIRIVTAAALFDGHDAAINIMRRIMQMKGAEIIHLGHNRSVAEIVEAAIEEDAHGIAITSYQGGHLEFFKYMKDLLDQQGCGHIRIFGGGGGTILPEEIDELHAYGITKIYSPDDGRKMGLEGMIEEVIHLSKPQQYSKTKKVAVAMGEVEDKVQRDGFWEAEQTWEHSTVLNEVKDIRKIARAITMAELGIRENDMPEWATTPKETIPVLGITGTGGAGKSSVTDELVRRFLHSFPDKTIAVISVDPSRKKTGGALLGDRIRMNSIHSPRAYMRSLATRESDVALSASVQDAINICRAAAFDMIVLESAGVGQSDASILDFCDLSLYVMTPEYGAASQLEKINMLDYADVIAINKFDKNGALDALMEVRKQYKRNHQLFTAKDETLPVIGTIAAQFNDAGVNRLFAKLITLIREKTGVVFGEIPDEAAKVEVTHPHIIPAKRVRYLSEIAEHNRAYDNWVKEQAALASQLYQLEGTMALVKDAVVSNGVKVVREELLKQLEPSNLKLLEAWPKLVLQYAGDYFEYQVRDKVFKQPLTTTSLSGTRVPRVVLPKYKDWGDLLKWQLQENLPGEFPYTAGVFPLKRAEEDPTRMFAGEGGPERTNKRFHYLSSDQPAKRLSTAFDSVTLYGEDPDHRPDIFGKIGNAGVSIATVDDAKKLYAGFDLCDPKTSVSMTINGPAPMLLAFFLNTAIDQQCEKYIQENGLQHLVNEAYERKYGTRFERPVYHNSGAVQGVTETPALLGLSGDEVLPPEVYNEIRKRTLSQVRGTVQADILKEDQAQNTCIFSTEFALRLMGDVQSYFIQHEVRNFYSVSISGYHIAEAGANPITQLAFTLSNGFTYVEYYLSRGMHIDAFAPNLSFFFSNGMDPEYSVIGRVARRIWAKAIKGLYKGNDRSQKLKYHIQTSGRSLHAQEIDFNDIRTTLQALYAIYDNCNSLHTNAYDEAITTPTEESVRRAMAIQLIINRELGTAKTENFIQGSFLIEELTDLVEEAVLLEFERISDRGGVLGAMERMYQRNKIQEESLHYEMLKHSGEMPIIGVNTFLNKKGSPTTIPNEVIRSSEEEKERQINNLRSFHHRNASISEQKLQLLKAAAVQENNLFEVLMDTVKYCSLGQITHALYEVGGQYRRNM